MRYILLITCFLLFSLHNGFAQNANCPANIDFEFGNFTNWDCFIGSTSVSGGTNVITLTPSAPMPGRHEIISAATAGNDPYGHFPQLCPYGGQYSVKLGNNGTGSEAEGISYTFQIPPSADTFAMTYYYAVVFEDPNHSTFEQPRFFVSAYDVLTGAVIHCASYAYVSNGSIPGFVLSAPGSDVLYKDWTPSSIDFSGLAGRTVRLEFKTADCTLGGHFGYAYLDVGAGCGGVMAVGAYCTETNSVTLNAPYGFQSYKWYNSNYTAVVGNTRTVTLSPPPPIASIFHVDMIPYPGYGCRDTADAMLTVLPVPDTPVAVSHIYQCQFDPVSQLTATGLPANELLWYTIPVGGTPLYIAPTPTTSVNGIFDYYVSQKPLLGCESARKKITVEVTPTPIVSFTINNPRQCQVGNNFLFSSTTTNVIAQAVYSWDFGDGETSALPVVSHVYIAPGSYTVTLTVSNSTACKKQLTKTVVVVQKPIAAFSYPLQICENQTQIILQDNSTLPGGLSTLNNWWWQIGTNISSAQNPPAFTTAGGILPVKLVVYTLEGCRSDTAINNLSVHFSPVPAFRAGPLLCDNEVIKLTDMSTLPAGAGADIINSWSWELDNIPSSTAQSPIIILPAAPHLIKLVAASNQGCNYRSADSLIIVHPKPAITLTKSDSCVNRNIFFNAGTNSAIPVNAWLWNFGSGIYLGNGQQVKNFSHDGANSVTLIGQTDYGCKDTIIRPFIVYQNHSKAMQDTVAALGEAVLLLVSDTTALQNYTWSPVSGLNDPTVVNPVALYDQDIIYSLNVISTEGCESNSKVFIRRYKGPELYVPSAFSPNGDGKNDVLHILPVGMAVFNYFSVYSRQGQLIFTAHNFQQGWDGTFKGMPAEPGNYVWVAMAKDYKGRMVVRKGNVLLLR